MFTLKKIRRVISVSKMIQYNIFSISIGSQMQDPVYLIIHNSQAFYNVVFLVYYSLMMMLFYYLLIALLEI